MDDGEGCSCASTSPLAHGSPLFMVLALAVFFLRRR
jgi:MYXO-CTERM domain-containing protein